MKNKALSMALALIMLLSMVAPLSIFAAYDDMDGLIDFKLTYADKTDVVDDKMISEAQEFRMDFNFVFDLAVLSGLGGIDDGTTKTPVDLPEHIKVKASVTDPIDLEISFDDGSPSLKVGTMIFEASGPFIIFEKDVFDELTEMVNDAIAAGDDLPWMKAFFLCELDNAEISGAPEITIQIDNDGTERKQRIFENQPEEQKPPTIDSKTGVRGTTDGQITWTIVLLPGTGETMKNIMLSDTFDEYQEYTVDSFTVQVGDSGTPEIKAAGLTDSTLTYLFTDGIEEKTIVTYQTRLNDNVFYDFDKGKLKTTAQTITNTAKLIDTDVAEPIELGQEVGTMDIASEWQVKNFVIEGDIITWTLTLNGNARALSSVTVHDSFGDYLEYVDGSLKCDTASVTVPANPTVSAGTGADEGKTFMEFDVTGLNKPATISYQTKILPKFYLGNYRNVPNNVYLSYIWGPGGGEGQPFELPPITKSANVASNMIRKTAKGYNTATREITWDIEVNVEQITDLKSATITDVIPAGQKFVSATLETGSFAEGPTVAGNTVTMKLDATGKVAQKITFVTMLTDPAQYAYDWKGSVTNSASIVGVDIGDAGITAGPSTATQSITSKMIEKKVVGYDYDKNQITWKVTFNHNGLELDNVIFNDILPEYVTLADGADSLKVNDMPTANEASDNTSINLNMDSINKKIEITYITDVDVNAIEKFQTQPSVSLTNNAAFNFREPDGLAMQLRAKDTAKIDNNIQKTSVYESDNGAINYTITINPNKVTFPQKLVLTDSMEEGILLDTDTVKLYEADVTTVAGKPVLTPDVGSAVGADELEGFSYQRPPINKFTLTIPNDGKAYVLKYTVDITDLDKSSFRNDAKINDVNFESEKVTGDIDTEESGSSGSAASRKGSITLTKKDAKDDKKLVEGATYVLYLGVEEIDRQTTDDKGELKFLYLGIGKTYIVREMTSPDEYELDSEEYEFTIPSGAARHMTKTVEDVPKLRVTYHANASDATTSVTDGNYYSKDDKVTVKSVEDTKRPGYEFIGWNTKADGTGTTYTFGGTNDFTITADTDLYAMWVATGDTKYVIEHYLQNNEDGTSFVLDTVENKTGPAGQTIYAQPKDYVGFIVDNTVTGAIPTGEVTADGKLVLKLYYVYDPNVQYTVNHYLQKGTLDEYDLFETATEAGDANTLVAAQPNDYEGFNFDRSVAGTVTSGMVAVDGSLVLNLYYNRTMPRYVVKHYLQSADDPDTYEEVTKDQLLKTAAVGTDVTAPKNTYAGFDYVDAQSNISGTVLADGSLVLNLYYDRKTDAQYKVEYYLQNDDGTFPAKAYSTDNFTAMVGEWVGALKKQFDGYTRDDNYIGTVGSGRVLADGSLTLKLYYTKDSAAAPTYTIKYYLQDSDGEGYTLEETYKGAGPDGAKVTAPQKKFEGYTFNSAAPGTLTTGNIAGDDSLVLELYYDKSADTAYAVEHYLQGQNGVYALKERANFEGTTGAEVTATPNTYAGYTFQPGYSMPSGVTGTVKADGSLVIQLYYSLDLAQYEVEYYQQSASGYTKVDKDTIQPKIVKGGTYVYAPEKVYPGYTLDTTVAGTKTDGTAIGDEILTLKLYYTRNDDTTYRIAYYLENMDKNGYDPVMADAAKLAADTGDTVSIPEKTYAGFTLDKTVTGTLEQGTVAGDGSLVLKLYYTRDTDTAYTVEYYLQNLDDPSKYTKQEPVDTKGGTTGHHVTAEEKEFTGFYFETDNASNIPEGDVAGDGSLVLKMHYKRNVYHVTYNANGGTTTVTDETDYLYQSTVDVKEQGDTEYGTNRKFLGWNTEPDGSGTMYNEEEGMVIDEITEDVELFAIWQLIGGGPTQTIPPKPSTTTPPPVETPVPQYDLILTMNLAPGQSEIVKPGETVDYVIVVKNTGKDTLTNVKVIAQLGDEQIELDIIESLAPGQEMEYGAEYIVPLTAKDKEVITNTSQATADQITTPRTGQATVIVTVPTVPPLLDGDHIWYLRGYPDNTMRPERKITRAEVCMVFYRFLKQNGNAPAVSSSPYSDVAIDEWYGVAIATLSELGIVQGYGESLFEPDRPITREEMAVIVIRFDGLDQVVVDPFSDVTPDMWSYQYILSAYQKGWVNGYPDGTFRPEEDMVRCEFASLVNNVLQRSIELADIPSNIHHFIDLDPSHWGYCDMVESAHTHDYVRKDDGENEIWTEILGTGVNDPYNQ